MASRAWIMGKAPALPFETLLSVIPSLPRPLLARLTARLIDRLDEIDGDPDLEPEEDCGQDEGEPDYRRRRRHRRNESGPGCPISDNDHGGEEVGELADYGPIGEYEVDQSRGPINVNAAINRWFSEREAR